MTKSLSSKIAKVVKTVVVFSILVGLILVCLLVQFPDSFDPLLFKVSEGYKFNKEEYTFRNIAIEAVERAGVEQDADKEFIREQTRLRDSQTVDNFPEYLLNRYILRREINDVGRQTADRRSLGNG